MTGSTRTTRTSPKQTVSASMRLALALLPTLLLLSGCSSPPKTQFYTLNAPPPQRAAGPSATVLAIGPIDLPEYLQRPQIVTRPEGNRLIVDEFNRWGGSLEEEIDRVLAQHLGALVGTQQVYSYPSRIVAGIDYRISLYLRAFDGALHNLLDARLMVAWTRALHAAGRTAEAQFLAARLQEFGHPLALKFFAECADAASAVRAFQCQPSTAKPPWRALLPE